MKLVIRKRPASNSRLAFAERLEYQASLNQPGSQLSRGFGLNVKDASLQRNSIEAAWPNKRSKTQKSKGSLSARASERAGSCEDCQGESVCCLWITSSILPQSSPFFFRFLFGAFLVRERERPSLDILSFLPHVCLPFFTSRPTKAMTGSVLQPRQQRGRNKELQKNDLPCPYPPLCIFWNSSAAATAREG